MGSGDGDSYFYREDLDTIYPMITAHYLLAFSAQIRIDWEFQWNAHSKTLESEDTKL